MRSRPYELVDVAGGFQHRTRRAYGEVIRASGTVASKGVDLTALEKLVLTQRNQMRAVLVSVERYSQLEQAST